YHWLLGSKSGQRRTPPLFELVVNPGLASNGGDSGTTPDAIFPKRKDRQVGISTRRFKQLALIGLGATGILAACSSNSGSSGSTGGACVGAVTLFDFSTGDEGWVFNTYQATNAAGVAVSPFNLAAPGNLSGG